MVRFNIKKKSIIFRVVLIVMIAVILQAAFSVGLIVSTNVSNILQTNSLKLFSEKVQNRNNYITNYMLNNLTKISEYKSEIESIYNSKYHSDDIKNLSSEDTTSFLNDCTNPIISMLNSNMSTGGFIILDDAKNKKSTYSCLYLNNNNPTNTNNIKDNLQMLRGPIEISKKYKIPLFGSWKYGVSLDDEHIGMLKKPMDATKLTTNTKYLGYWHISASFSNQNYRIITYSLPLLDKNNNPFGVIGIEIAQDFLYKLLPFDEFASSGSYGYIISTKTKNDEIIPLISQGTVQNSIAKINTPLKLNNENEQFKCYSLDTNIGEMVVTYELIELYDNNSPYEDESLYLMGLIDKNNITSFANSLNNSLIFVVVISIIIGAVLSYLGGYYYSRPIIRLNNEVSKSEPGEIFKFKKVGILEIDDLADAIEQLNKNVLESILKTDKIMELTNIVLGSFEYINNSSTVIVSSTMQEMLHITSLSINKFTIDKQVFFDILNDIKTRPEEEMDDTYIVEFFPKKWYRITEIANNDGLFGVVIDVTHDVLERYSLNYERDYDMLTGIYNRLAFKRKATSIFTSGNLDIAAIAMFDLDNLKYVNDTYGHETGDIYIKTAAQFMNEELNRNAVIGRMSGDEFFAFLYNFDSKENLLELLKNLYIRLDTSPIILPDGNEFKIRMSGGISWYKDDSKDLDELIKFADFAMYEGKHTVKGELREFKKNVYLAESFMLSGKEELNRILDNQFIDYVFQPIIDVKNGEIYAYEALMRPQSTILNTPTKLIQIATAQSQLWKIEKITFFKVLAEYVKYKEMFKDAKIFINSVPNEILKDSEYKEFERLYHDVLGNVIIEIIENEKLDSNILNIKLEKFSSWNSKIALDDYGAGYNNDLSLLSLNPYIVKLDRFLVSNVDTDISRQAIITKIIGFCKESNILVLAEGVETYEQMEYLISVGVDLLQGFYISKPLSLPNYNISKIKNEILQIIN